MGLFQAMVELLDLSPIAIIPFFSIVPILLILFRFGLIRFRWFPIVMTMVVTIPMSICVLPVVSPMIVMVNGTPAVIPIVILIATAVMGRAAIRISRIRIPSPIIMDTLRMLPYKTDI